MSHMLSHIGVTPRLPTLGHFSARKTTLTKIVSSECKKLRDMPGDIVLANPMKKLIYQLKLPHTITQSFLSMQITNKFTQLRIKNVVIYLCSKINTVLMHQNCFYCQML